MFDKIRLVLCATMAAMLPMTGAHAAVTISSAATQNMSCTSGVCTPTAANAVLNASDLTSMLASGNVTVNTGTGSLAQQVEDILVTAGFNWASANALTLDAYRSVTISAPVAVNGSSDVALLTDDGGSDGYLSFISGGSLSFLGTTNSVSINGAAYTLENSVPTLASAVTANPAGNYALANSYDAKTDGTYRNSPISVEFSGNFEGFGNTISDLSLKGTGNANDYVGLFGELALNNQAAGSIENVSLQNVKVTGKLFVAGGLVGNNTGRISGSFVGGSVNSKTGSEMGLLVGANAGTITRSGAVGSVSEGAGGLAGTNEGSVSQSYADCTVSVNGGGSTAVGGLVGGNFGIISDSYALGKVSTGGAADIGGLVGENYSEGTITQVYSTTAVKSSYPDKGGLIGADYSPKGSNTSAYWDTTTSKVGNNHGAGNVKNDPGITGLTTAQLQSALPAGFDPTIWAQSPSINGGLPYLINNPPR
jgi:hypothetical protein